MEYVANSSKIALKISSTYSVFPRTFLVNNLYGIVVAMQKINEKLMVFLIMGLLVQQYQVKAGFMLAVSLVQFAWSAFEMINTVHDTYGKFAGASVGDIMEKSEELAQSVDRWGGRIEDKIEKSVDGLLTRLPLLGQIVGDIRFLNTYIGRIDELYADVREYLEHPEHFTNRSTLDLIKACISRDGDDVQGTIAQIHGLIVPPKKLGNLKKSLFLLLAEETRAWKFEACGTGASPQQRLVDLYDIAMESEMRAFAMISFGYLMQGHMENKNLTNDFVRARDKLVVRAKEYMLLLKTTMSRAATVFRRCDPPGGHVRGVTYFEFERFVQSYVVQESVMREDNTCPERCGGYFTQPSRPDYGCAGFGCSIDAPTACLGKITQCERIEHDVTVCEKGALEARRYEWVVDGDGVLYGDNENGCIGNITTAMKDKKCDVCRCICVEDLPRSKANRFISLREKVTDVDNNMVVTGLAFVIVNRILHIRVMQGKLAPRGEIVENSTVWLEPEDIYYDEAASIKDQSAKFWKKSENGADEAMIKEKDVAALRWSHKRIHLDNLRLPENHLVTGIRFRRLTGAKFQPIQLEIQGTRFDTETDQLVPDSSTWVTPDDMTYVKEKKEREEYEDDESRNPLLAPQTSINSRPYSFIRVHWSSFEHDAGQTTLPLLDGLPVVSDPPSPLVGVGLYHKSGYEYGGFLTFVLEGIDKSPYLSTDF